MLSGHDQFPPQSRALVTRETAARRRKGGTDFARYRSEEVLGMKCQEFEPIIISLARGQLVETSARETALGHLERCAHCAIAFEEQQALTVGIRVAAESLPRGASAQVEVALRRAFREQAGRFVTTGINPQTKWNWLRSWRLVGAAAAIILLALLAGVSWLKSTPTNQKREVINHPATPSIADPGQKQESHAQI